MASDFYQKHLPLCFGTRHGGMAFSLLGKDLKDQPQKVQFYLLH